MKEGAQIDGRLHWRKPQAVREAVAQGHIKFSNPPRFLIRRVRAAMVEVGDNRQITAREAVAAKGCITASSREPLLRYHRSKALPKAKCSTLPAIAGIFAAKRCGWKPSFRCVIRCRSKAISIDFDLHRQNKSTDHGHRP